MGVMKGKNCRKRFFLSPCLLIWVTHTKKTIRSWLLWNSHYEPNWRTTEYRAEEYLCCGLHQHSLLFNEPWRTKHHGCSKWPFGKIGTLSFMWREMPLTCQLFGRNSNASSAASMNTSHLFLKLFCRKKISMVTLQKRIIWCILVCYIIFRNALLVQNAINK